MKLKIGKKHIIIPAAAVLLLAAAAAVFAAARPSQSEDSAPQISFVKLEGACGTVRFSPIDTSPEVYEELLLACDASRLTAEETGTAVSNQTVVVSEDTFVDAGSAETSEETMIFVESETVYFRGTVLVHYASHSGDHVTFAAHHDADGYPLVLSIDGLALEGFGRVREPESEAPAEAEAMDESRFLAAINRCAAALIMGADVPADTELLFTQNGRAALARVGQYVGADGAAEIKVVLSCVGSSRAEEMLADRILLRCRLTGAGSATLDLLLKLNEDLMVYDVDLM